MLAQMEQQAQAANAGQAPRNVAQEMLSLLPSVLAAGPGGPALLSQAVGVPYEVAEAFINSYNTGLGGQALQADLTQRMGG